MVRGGTVISSHRPMTGTPENSAQGILSLPEHGTRTPARENTSPQLAGWGYAHEAPVRHGVGEGEGVGDTDAEGVGDGDGVGEGDAVGEGVGVCVGVSVGQGTG